MPLTSAQVGGNMDLPTHLRCSVLRRPLACAQLSLAVAFSSLIVIAVVAAGAGAHDARTGHVMVEGTWVVGRCWAGGHHVVGISRAV